MLTELASSVQRALTLIGTVYLIFAVAIVLILCMATFFLVRMFVKFVQVCGDHQVLCPETGRIAIIRIDAVHAAGTSLVDDPELQVSDCTRWPERQDCRQKCLQHYLSGSSAIMSRSSCE